MTTNSFTSDTGEKPSLDELRKGLTVIQRTLLEELWRCFFEKQQWPSTRSIYSKHEKPVVRASLSPLTGNVLTEHQNNGQNELALNLLGVLMMEKGASYQELLSRFFELQHDLFRKSPEAKSITSEEIGISLSLSQHDLKVLGMLVRLAHISGGYGSGDNHSWTASTMAEAEDFPYGGTFLACVEQWALRFYDANLAVFKDEQSQAHFNSAEAAFVDTDVKPVAENYDPRSDNPLEKRYQVFVSSTYEDLIEERKHVIQALLVTKCIPSGMELFPATSTKQWKLITSVIDDCDYYVVVVAGKYGSIGAKGKSYTEMEFDYALSKGKSILGFIHRDVRSLPAYKTEESDQSRNKLKSFTAKVKGLLLCQFWNSPEGLASELKTSIMHAIENDPKPGWVRSSEVPSWKLVSGLKERIADLEAVPKVKKPEDNLPIGEDIIEFPAIFRWSETNEPNRYGNDRKRFIIHFEIKMTWDSTFLCFHLKAGELTNKSGLIRRFHNELTKLCRSKIKKQSDMSSLVDLSIQLEPDLFEKVFQTFVARNYFTPATARTRGTNVKYKLSTKGIRKLAECESKRLNQQGQELSIEKK